MDKITIADFEVFYRVGVPEGERESPQRLLLTVEFDHDLERAAATDDLAATIDRVLDVGEDRVAAFLLDRGVEQQDEVVDRGFTGHAAAHASSAGRTARHRGLPQTWPSTCSIGCAGGTSAGRPRR